MITWSVIAGLVVSLGVLTLTRSLLTPGGLLLLSMTPPLLGFGHYADQRGFAGAALLVAAFPIVFAIGVADLRKRSNTSEEAVDQEFGWMAASLLLIPIVLIHFSGVGIAVLSNAAEVQRFTLDSGYGGIPSRVVLFVVPILTLAASVRAEGTPRSALRIFWALFILSRLAMGFKSGLLEVLIMIIVVLMLRGVILTVRSSVLVTLALGSALVYANWVGTRYSTLQSNTLSFDYLLDRLGRQTAEPALAALSYARLEGATSFWIHDVAYFAGRYSGFGHPGNFPIDQVVSSAIYGTPLSHSEFLVPVTVGGPSYLIGSLGDGVTALSVVAVVVSFFVIGRVWRSVCAELRNGSSARRAMTIASAGTLLGLRSFLMNGGGGYVVINYLASILVAIILVEVMGNISRKAGNASKPAILVASPERFAASKGPGSAPPVDP